MELNIHTQMLGAVFAIAVVMGTVTNKTNFCAMGAVSDWVNIGHTGRMRAWVFSMAVALAGVIALEATGIVNLSSETFPPTARRTSRGYAISSAASCSASA